MFHFRQRFVAIFVFVSMLSLSPAVHAADLSGKYEGDNLTLVLAPDPAVPGGYSGTITLKGRDYPAHASTDPVKGAKGAFASGDDKFPFSLRQENGQFVLTSGTATYRLKRQDVPPGPPNGPPAAAAPGILKIGTRLVYQEGQSIVHNVDFHLVPVGDGKFRAQDDKNSGGAGYRTVDVIQVAPNFIAADSRTYRLADIQADRTTLSGANGVAGNATSLGIYWISPARLAAMPQGRDADRTVNRVRYELNGRTYNALSILTDNENVYDSQIFDLETGLMLSTTHKYQGDPVTVPVQGGLGQARGAAVIEHSRFIGTRDVNLPWANAPTPQWVQRGRVLNYQGTYASVNPGAGPLAFATTRQVTIDDVVNGCAMVTTFTRKDIGRGLPAQEATDKRTFGSSMTGGLWMPPKALQQLRPNQAIDEDRVTHFRSTFAGIQGNLAVFIEQGPIDQVEYRYDMASGMLAGVRITQQQPTGGQFQTEYQLVGQQ